MARQLVLATRNAGKISEMQRLFQSFNLDCEVISSSAFDLPDVEETGSSFEENAILKASTISRATKLPAIADDSGLCIDALDGAPGIFSARWAGVHGDDAANITRVLDQISHVAEGHRGARFVCVIALALPNGSVEVVRGELPGKIRRSAVGTNGFGYDPIFEPEGYTMTLAEMLPEKKDELSHRARALREIAPRIAPFLGL
jgi:XTP/dITP diphosphohydrolase